MTKQNDKITHAGSLFCFKKLFLMVDTREKKIVTALTTKYFCSYFTLIHVYNNLIMSENQDLYNHFKIFLKSYYLWNDHHNGEIQKFI